MAADARVTWSTIQTGGVFGQWVRSGRVMNFQGPTWRHRWANQDLRTFAEQSGGIASIYQDATRAFDRLDRATRFQYVLGYYPQNQDTAGDFRRITVRVNRPNVEVLHRYGYYARAEPLAADRRVLFANTRMSAAANYRGVINEIPLTLSGSFGRDRSDGGDVTIHVRVAPGAIAFSETAGRQVAALDVALYVGDSNRQQIGEFRKRVDLNLLPESHLRMSADGVMFSATVPFKGRARYVKAVVYQFDTDRLGTAVLDLRR